MTPDEKKTSLNNLADLVSQSMSTEKSIEDLERLSKDQKGSPEGESAKKAIQGKKKKLAELKKKIINLSSLLSQNGVSAEEQKLFLQIYFESRGEEHGAQPPPAADPSSNRPKSPPPSSSGPPYSSSFDDFAKFVADQFFRPGSFDDVVNQARYRSNSSYESSVPPPPPPPPAQREPVRVNRSSSVGDRYEMGSIPSDKTWYNILARGIAYHCGCTVVQYQGHYYFFGTSQNMSIVSTTFPVCCDMVEKYTRDTIDDLVIAKVVGSFLDSIRLLSMMFRSPTDTMDSIQNSINTNLKPRIQSLFSMGIAHGYCLGMSQAPTTAESRQLHEASEEALREWKTRNAG